MKRTSLILMSIILCFVFVGCTNNTQKNNSQAGSQKQAESQEQTKISRIPASAVKTDINGLYKFNNGINNFSQTVDASISGDILRFEFIEPGLDASAKKIVLYSLSEDKISGEVSLPEDMWSTGELDNGGFYACSLTSGEVVFYDRNCKETFRKKISDQKVLWNSAAVSNDGKYMLYNRATDGCLLLHTFSSGESKEIGDITGVFVPIGFKNGCFYVQNYEKGIFRVSPELKSLELVYNDANIGFTSTAYSIGVSDTYFTLTPFDNPNERKMTRLNSKNELPMAANSDFFVTGTYNDGDKALRIYNIKESTVSPALSVPGYVQKLLFCGNNMLLVMSFDSSSESISYYLYDLTVSSGYKNIDISKADDSAPNGESVSKLQGDSKTIALAQNILETYGVRVLYGSGDIDTNAYSYASGKADDKSIYAKMQDISKVLAYFPKGMTNEIGRGQEIWIYLCGKLQNTATGGYVDGFATQHGIYPLIIIDVNCSDNYFSEMLVHEMSHLIDYCVNAKWINGWTNLLPESIMSKAYLNSYNEKDSNAYTPYDSGATEVWFYNNYARTYPNEDRAVIFQKMYLSYVDGKMTDEFKTYENLLKKARYYCVMLRSNFESCRNADTLPWEKPLGNIDLNEFSYIK